MSHEGRVLLHVLLCQVLALISVEHVVRLLHRKMLAMSCMPLLCLGIQKPFMYLFVHLDKRWGHVSILRGAKSAMYVWVYVWPRYVFL